MRYHPLLIFAIMVFTPVVKSAPQSPSIYDLTLRELLDVKVITAASGFEQKLKRAASNATVVTREEWQAMGAVTLADVMATIPGVHVIKSTVNHKHNLFSIRGLSGSFNEQVKLLIDGQSWENMKDGGRENGFNMPLDMFKRIEVIKGPGSAIYGADAFGGIINLVTYKNQHQPDTVNFRHGSFNTHSVSMTNSFALDEQYLNLSFNYIKSDDDPGRLVEQDLQTQLDSLFDTQASHAPGPMDEHFEVLTALAQWRWQRWSLDYYGYRNFDMGMGVGIAQALDPEGYSSNYRHRVSLARDLSNWVDNGLFDLTVNYYRSKSYSYFYIFPRNAVLPIGADGNINFVEPAGLTRFEQGVIGTPNHFHIVRNLKLTRLLHYNNHTIRWALGYDHLSLTASERKNFGPNILDGTQTLGPEHITDVTNTPWIYLPNKKRHFRYMSLLDEWDVSDDLLINLGARFDHYSDFGSTTNPRLSLSYRFNPQLTIKLFAGSAFRAPSITELYIQNNPVGIGNENLGPEGVDTLESGLNIDWTADDNLLFSIRLFNYRANDLIRNVFVAQINGNQTQNIGRQKGQGGELTFKWKPQQNITISAHYSRLMTENSAGLRVPDIPGTMIYWDMNWQIDDNLQWYINTKWVKDRKRPETDSRPEIDDYSLTNTRLSYRGLLPGLTLSLSAKNLFDNDAREPSTGAVVNDYPLAGRQWVFSLEYRY